MNSKKLFYIIGFGTVIILAIVIIVIGIINASNSETISSRNHSSSQNQQNTIDLITIIPEKNSQLQSGQKQSFNAGFNSAPDSLNITVSRIDVVSNQTENDLPFKKAIQDTKIKITLDEEIKPYSEYTLSFFEGNRLIASVPYTSTNQLPTRVQNNNNELQEYLPYETHSYSLKYDPQANMYIFSFIYNPNSPTTLQQQFEAAKQDATSFIESKGIDIDSVIIEWNYS